MPSDLSAKKATKSIPTALYNFLCWLLEGCDDQSSEELTLCEKVGPSSSAGERRVLSVGQDLLFATNHGHVKTVKHISLAMSVKQMTVSTKIVTCSFFEQEPRPGLDTLTLMLSVPVSEILSAMHECCLFQSQKLCQLHYWLYMQ